MQVCGVCDTCLLETPALVGHLSNKQSPHNHHTQDIEFTVQEGKLYVLQCRSGKRTAKAAVKVAVDMVRVYICVCGCLPFASIN
jgi:hypothetical protein